MTPEQQQQIENEAKAANRYIINGNSNKVRCFNEGYITAATKYLSIIEEKDREIERLKASIAAYDAELRTAYEIINSLQLRDE